MPDLRPGDAVILQNPCADEPGTHCVIDAFLLNGEAVKDGVGYCFGCGHSDVVVDDWSVSPNQVPLFPGRA